MVFHHQGEGNDTMQALRGKCVFLLLTANIYKGDGISVNYGWETCV